jgi:hypothetical protein
MWNEYAREKMKELDAELARKHSAVSPVAPRTQHRPLAPVVRATGRRFRRLGEALESWAQPCPTAGNQRG